MERLKGYKIANLDSGLGGLTVIQEMVKQFPENDFIHFGDSINAPYGDRPAEEIRALTQKIVDFLLDMDVDAIMLACNTITSYCYEDLRKELDIPVLGTVKSGAGDAAKLIKEGWGDPKIGVLATRATCRSHAYKKELEKLFDGPVEVIEHPCPSLCPAVEKGTYSKEELMQIVNKDLEGFPKDEVKTIILGCTHFPILAEEIQESVGQNTKLVNPAKSMAALLQEELAGRPPKHKKDPDEAYSRTYYSSGDLDTLKKAVQDLVPNSPEGSQTFYKHQVLN